MNIPGSANSPTSQRKHFGIAMILIVSLFLLWGIANNLNDILIPQFKKAFKLTDFQSGLVQSAFYVGYFVFAIPAAFFMQRFGYKAAVVLGLCLYGAGALLFFPAAEFSTYAGFLCALFILASGLAFLETSANPLVAQLGNPTTAERRLNLAQAFNPLGAIAGVFIGREFILSGIEYTPAELAALSTQEQAAFHAAETAAVQGPYIILGTVVLVWAILICLTPFPTIPEESHQNEPRGRFAELGQHPTFVLGVIAQFFYVGAQVGIWSFLIRYSQSSVPGTGEKLAASYLTYSLVAFMLGRFIGTALMGRVRASTLLSLFAIANIGLTLVAVFQGGMAGVIALAATSFFMSIMFPTIFAISIKGLGPLTKPGASLLVMAIIGGAVLTALMGYISDHSSIGVAMLIPTISFVVILLFSLSRGARSIKEVL